MSKSTKTTKVITKECNKNDNTVNADKEAASKKATPTKKTASKKVTIKKAAPAKKVTIKKANSGTGLFNKGSERRTNSRGTGGDPNKK